MKSINEINVSFSSLKRFLSCALTVEKCDKRIIVSLKKKILLSGNNYVNSDFLQNGFQKIKGPHKMPTGSRSGGGEERHENIGEGKMKKKNEEPRSKAPANARL